MELMDFVGTFAHVSPRDGATVVLIEDLHWIDAASEEFVEALADAVVGTTTLLFVNFRPGFVAPLHAANTLSADRRASLGHSSTLSSCCKGIMARSLR